MGHSWDDEHRERVFAMVESVHFSRRVLLLFTTHFRDGLRLRFRSWNMSMRRVDGRHELRPRHGHLHLRGLLAGLYCNLDRTRRRWRNQVVLQPLLKERS